MNSRSRAFPNVREYPVMRSARPVASLLQDIRRAVRSIDPEQPVHQVATMREVTRQTITPEATASFLTAFFAGEICGWRSPCTSVSSVSPWLKRTSLPPMSNRERS
jgi:hypothetical protein